MPLPNAAQILALTLLGAVLCELEHRRKKYFDRRRLLRHTSEQKRFLRSWRGICLSSELPFLEFGPHLGSGAFVSSSLILICHETALQALPHVHMCRCYPCLASCCVGRPGASALLKERAALCVYNEELHR